MNRRAFLAVGALPLASALPRTLHAQSTAADRWRTFEISTHVHVQNASGVTRVWVPTPLAVAPYQKTLGDTYHVDEGSVTMVEREGLDLLAAEWNDGFEPILSLTSRVATTARVVNFTRPDVAPPKDFSAFSAFLRAPRTALDDAALKSRVAAITARAGTDLERARAIYEWTIAQPSRTTGSTDPNTTFITMARLAGLPARPVYGLRLSNLDATKAQEARVEVYLVGFGWVPLDAAGTRFGSWDTAWIAYNSAQDIVLPGSSRGSIAYFMHPHCETAGKRLNSLEPEAFRYTISVTESP